MKWFWCLILVMGYNNHTCCVLVQYRPISPHTAWNAYHVGYLSKMLYHMPLTCFKIMCTVWYKQSTHAQERQAFKISRPSGAHIECYTHIFIWCLQDTSYMYVNINDYYSKKEWSASGDIIVSELGFSTMLTQSCWPFLLGKPGSLQGCL